MNFLEKAKTQLEYMRRINAQVKSDISVMPEGSLVHKFAKGHTYYYASNNGKLISLQDDPRLRQLLMETFYIHKGRIHDRRMIRRRKARITA